jgi:hypothetical protein
MDFESYIEGYSSDSDHQDDIQQPKVKQVVQKVRRRKDKDNKEVNKHKEEKKSGKGKTRDRLQFYIN